MERNGKAKTVLHSSSTASFAEAVARKRTGPGVLMFTEKLKLLFLNSEALACNQRLLDTGSCRAGRGLVAPGVMSLCEEVLAQVKRRCGPGAWEPCQLTRVADTPSHPILLRGMAVPASRSILILIEIFGPRRRMEMSIHIKHKLSDRERAVVTCLASGMTNRAIAQQLGLSEHTVKDHLRHVMHKTKTHSRTELLAKVAFATGLGIDGEALPPLDDCARSEDEVGVA